MLPNPERNGAPPLSCERGGAPAACGATLPAVPSDASDAASAALAYLRQRERLLARLQRVNDAISANDEYEANRHLPVDLRRKVRPPTLSRQALAGLHQMLVEELARLEGREGPEGRAGLPPSPPLQP